MNLTNNTISENNEIYFTSQIRQNNLNILFSSLTTIAFLISLFFIYKNGKNKYETWQVYFLIILGLYFTIGNIYRPVKKYLLLNQIICKIERNGDWLKINTLNKNIINTNVKNVIETTELFKYFNQVYEAKKFVVNDKSYYFPFAEMV